MSFSKRSVLHLHALVLIHLLGMLVEWPEVDGACVQTDACSCRDSETGHTITLLGLSKFEGSQSAFFQTSYKWPSPPTLYNYFYNPCFNVDVGGCNGVAACQTNNNSNASVPLGMQTTAKFEDDGGNLSIYYEQTATDNVTRMSRVYLHCAPNATQHTFVARDMSVYLTFEFDLTSPCVCAGQAPKYCSAMPVACHMDGRNKCQCRYSDGRGVVNLHSIDNASSPLVVQVDDERLHQAAFNPCTGFNWAEGQFDPGLCRNSTTCFAPIGDQWYDYGVAESTFFQAGPDGDDLTLMYWSEDRNYHSEIKLVCDPAQRQRPMLAAPRGGPQQGLLQLELRTICACAGGCLPQERTCSAKDPCTCDLNQNLGRISLHALDNSIAPLQASNSSDTIVYYNPCSPFTVPGLGSNCVNVSACQVCVTKEVDMSLGSQKSVSFRANSFTNEVTAYYQGGTNGTHFSVDLRCDLLAVAPQLTFQGETSPGEYSFALRSRCACPDGC